MDGLYKNNRSTVIETKHIYVVFPNNALPCLSDTKHKMTLACEFNKYGGKEQVASTENRKCAGYVASFLSQLNLISRS